MHHYCPCGSVHFGNRIFVLSLFGNPLQEQNLCNYDEEVAHHLHDMVCQQAAVAYHDTLEHLRDK